MSKFYQTSPGGNAASNAAGKVYRTSSGQFASSAHSKQPTAGAGMSGNGGNAAGKQPAPIAPPAGALGRPPTDTPEYRAWANHLLETPAAAGFVKYVMWAGMGLQHAVNAYIDTDPLAPRCRNPNCNFHMRRGISSNCPRGQAGSGKEGENFARSGQYMTSDMRRAIEYAEEASRHPSNHHNTPGALLKFVVIVPAGKVFVTTQADVIASPDRNAWWQKDGFSMIVVSDSMGNYLNNYTGYDAAVMDLSLVNIVHIHSCYSTGFNAQWGLAMNEAADGVIVTNAIHAAKFGIFATRTMADDARRDSQLPWDVHDREMAAVSTLCFSPICLCTECAVLSA